MSVISATLPGSGRTRSERRHPGNYGRRMEPALEGSQRFGETRRVLSCCPLRPLPESGNLANWRSEKASHLGKEFGLLGRVLEEIGGEGDPAGFEDRDGAGAAKGEEAPFVASGYGLVGSEGLIDRTDIGGADFERENGAQVFCFEGGEHALVFPEVAEVPAQGEGGDREEGAVEKARFTRDSGGGKVVAVVIDGAEAGEDEGALGKALGEICRAEEGGEVKMLPFHENGIDLRDVRESEVPPVAGKDEMIGVRVEGAGLGSELADEKLIEARKGLRGICKIVRIESILLNKRGHPRFAGGVGHAATVASGEEVSFDEVSQNRATRVFVGKTQPALTVDLLGFERSGHAIKIADRLHGPTLPLA